MKTAFREKLRHYSKRAYTLRHALNDGVWSPSINDTNAEITTPRLIDLENTRRNYLSEVPVTRDLLSRARFDDVVWDIGAGYGTEACLLAQHVSRVISVDADPVRSRFIEVNAMRNELSNISAVEAFLGESVEYPSVSGNELADKHEFPDVLRLDIEGGERLLLEELRDIIDSVRLVYVEVHPTMLPEHEQMIRDLEAAEFEVKRIHERGDQYFIRGISQKDAG